MSVNPPAVRARITNPLFKNRQETVAFASLIHQWSKLESTDRFENFLRVTGEMDGGHKGRYFNDSDVYKWLEAVAYGLKFELSESVLAAANRAIEAIQKCQEQDGYINTFFQLNHPDLKWRNTMMMHEMYCIGHLIEAGVAWYEETDGKDRRLLDVALKAAQNTADHFGPDKKLGYPGHEEIELALFRLADATGDTKWSDLAGWMIDKRGSRPSPFELEMADKEGAALSPWAETLLCKDGQYLGEYLQDHKPVRELDSTEGHAVRAMYFYIAAAEWAMRSEDQGLGSTLVNAWNKLGEKRLYITGGVGPSGDNEGFTQDYDLPNLTAYAETCAGCALFWWGSRMVRLTDDAYCIETMERVLMNNILAGISLDGEHYFYDNPLESRKGHKRVPWFSCACCPPNVARLILSLDKYIARPTEDGLVIDLPIDSEITAQIKGVEVGISIESDYPWGNKIVVTVRPQKPVHFKIRVPWPMGCDSAEIATPRHLESGLNDRWFWVSGEWSEPTAFSIEFVREPVWLSSHPQVLDNVGRAALTCGPVVYCCESPDLPEFDDEGFYPLAPHHLRAITIRKPEPLDDLMPFPVRCFEVPVEMEIPGAKMQSNRPHVRSLDDIPVEEIEEEEDDEELTEEDLEAIKEAGYAADLYPPYRKYGRPNISVRFIPYFLWNNRGPSHMLVWMRAAEPEFEDYPSLN